MSRILLSWIILFSILVQNTGYVTIVMPWMNAHKSSVHQAKLTENQELVFTFSGNQLKDCIINSEEDGDEVEIEYLGQMYDVFKMTKSKEGVITYYAKADKSESFVKNLVQNLDSKESKTKQNGLASILKSIFNNESVAFVFNIISPETQTGLLLSKVIGYYHLLLTNPPTPSIEAPPQLIG